SRVIRISLFYQNSTCFVSAYFLKHHPFLYVRIYPGNVMDVIGFDAYSLTRTEVEDSKLRLFTRFTSLPMIPIDTGAASSIANHLHAMNNKGYTYNFNFNDVVNKKRAEIESLTGLPVPVLA
ncbi:hypothetical protein P7F73_23135, partial [Enterobacter sp. EC-ML 621]|nr:hypothetical protein [Enterobacter sp. EC-ML 621]